MSNRVLLITNITLAIVASILIFAGCSSPKQQTQTQPTTNSIVNGIYLPEVDYVE